MPEEGRDLNRGFAANQLHDHTTQQKTEHDNRKKQQISQQNPHQVFVITHGCGSDHKTGSGASVSADGIADQVITHETKKNRTQGSSAQCQSG